MMAASESLDQNASDWNHYSLWNRRHEGLAALWIRDLVSWVKASSFVNAHKSILDFGCGYFDVGLAVRHLFARVDGFDISRQACGVAAMRIRDFHQTSNIYTATHDIPRVSYDLIIVNSVVQYFGNKETLTSHFSLWRGLLRREGASQIILSDLIPSDYVAWRDAIRSLRVALPEGLLWPMSVHLWKAATKPSSLALLTLDFAELTKLAKEEGLTASLLPTNLTPSRQRYAVRLALG